jgi:ABC-2 type transport system permease protein
MTKRPLAVLLRKELLDLSRNRGALIPVVIVALLVLVLPFTIVIGIPNLTGDPLSLDADLTRLAQVMPTSKALTAEGRIQLFLFQQFLTLFLLMPATGGMALAAHAIVGEKQAKTLEPLLATPISTMELLIAKVLGALIPTLAIAFTGTLVFIAGIGLLADRGVLEAMMNARTVLLILLVAPATALLSLQAAMIISARANDARTAQQFGVLIVLPLTGLVMAQFMGLFWLSARDTALLGLAVLALWMIVAVVSAAIFQREVILTRWR